MYCPHCGKEIRDEAAVYCPFCSKPLRVVERKKSGFPVVAGILTIFAACLSSFVGVLFMGAYIWYSIQGSREGIGVFLTGFIGILGFAFGLASGITSLRRRYFGLSIAGLSLLIFSGFVIIFGMAMRGYRQAVSDALTFGVPVIGLAILSLIFVAVSKEEFS